MYILCIYSKTKIQTALFLKSIFFLNRSIAIWRSAYRKSRCYIMDMVYIVTFAKMRLHVTQPRKIENYLTIVNLKNLFIA